MTAGVKVTITDKGAQKLLTRLLQNGALSVGILESSSTHTGAAGGGATHKPKPSAKSDAKALNDIFAPSPKEPLTIGEIAAIHEFGLGSIPRRSFLADWADEQNSKVVQIVIDGAKALASGRLSSPLQFLNQVGAWAVGDVQRRMAQNIPPPLSPVTIKRKGSSVALIDTGQLRSSITYRVDAVETAKGGVRILSGAERGQ